MVAGRAEGGFTQMFEIICGHCGDHADLAYWEVSPELRRIRGPYPLGPGVGVAAYERHFGLHQRLKTSPERYRPVHHIPATNSQSLVEG